MENKLILSDQASVGLERKKQDSIQIWAWLNSPRFSKSTKDLYLRIVKDFFHFHSSLGVKEIGPSHITVFLAHLKPCSASTRNTYRNGLSSLFRYLEESGYIQKSPVKIIKAEKVPDKFQFKILDMDQIRRMILMEKNKRNQILLKLLYYTGLRISEALSLKAGSFMTAQEGGAFITVIGKGYKTRTVLTGDSLWKELRAYLSEQKFQGNEFLFSSEEDRSRPISRIQAFRIVKMAAVNAKVHPLPSPHWFRHTSATHAIENGAPIHVVQATLGHASTSTTGKYLKARPTQSNSSFLKKIKA